MSCGLLSEKQNELLGRLTSLSSADGVLGLLDLTPFTFPTSGQGIAEALGVGAKYATLTTDIQRVEQFIADVKNGMIPIPTDLIPPKLKSLHTDVKEVINKVKPAVNNLSAVVLDAEGIANEVKNLKSKWGDIDVGAGGLEALPGLIKTGALDLESVCNKIDNLQKSADGLRNVLKGKPITPPDEDPAPADAPEPVPDIPVPTVTQDIERRVNEILAEFEEIEKPALYNKLEANEKTKILSQIAGRLGI